MAFSRIFKTTPGKALGERLLMLSDKARNRVINRLSQTFEGREKLDRASSYIQGKTSKLTNITDDINNATQNGRHALQEQHGRSNREHSPVIEL